MKTRVTEQVWECLFELRSVSDIKLGDFEMKLWLTIFVTLNLVTHNLCDPQSLWLSNFVIDIISLSFISQIQFYWYRSVIRYYMEDYADDWGREISPIP